jgi:hypothetical protein
LTGTAHRVASLIKRPIVVGIVLSLGFGFMIEGAKMMALNSWIAAPALLCTSLLLTNRVVPAMFLLLMFGAAYGVATDPTLLEALRGVRVEPRMPSFALADLTLNDLFIGAVFLALPQVPHTLGNAAILAHQARAATPVSAHYFGREAAAEPQMLRLQHRHPMLLSFRWPEVLIGERGRIRHLDHDHAHLRALMACVAAIG